MSLLSTNNLITDDILFENGFRKNAYIYCDIKHNMVYTPNHFYKDVKIKVKTLDFDNLAFVFSCMGILDYDPSNQSITLFCRENIFQNNILFREKIEDEVDLKAVISYVENHIYDPLHELTIHK